jgi:hypothetical protein
MIPPVRPDRPDPPAAVTPPAQPQRYAFIASDGRTWRYVNNGGTEWWETRAPDGGVLAPRFPQCFTPEDFAEASAVLRRYREDMPHLAPRAVRGADRWWAQVANKRGYVSHPTADGARALASRAGVIPTITAEDLAALKDVEATPMEEQR